MKALISLLAIAPLTITPLATALPAAAQSLPSLPIQFNPAQINTTRTGSTSGECSAGERPPSAIAYTDSQTTASTRTTQAQPTLWFYLPVPLTPETEALFTLKGSLDSPVGAPLYEGVLSGQTDSAGIISIPLSISLNVGDLYQWSLTLNCADDETIAMSGWIERRALAPALRSTFEAVGDRNRAALYANYGFLQDAIDELATLRQVNPDSEAIAQDWNAFLSDLNLSELTASSLLNCCQVGSKPAEENPREESEAEEAVPEEMPLEEMPEEVPEEVQEPEQPSVEESEQPEEDTRTILQRARDKG